MRGSRSAIGVSEPVPASSCQRRREKLSTTETSWPRAEKWSAVGQPRYPSPPRMRILIGAAGYRTGAAAVGICGTAKRHSIRPMGNGLAARNGGRVGLAALVAILLLGFGLRVGE